MVKLQVKTRTMLRKLKPPQFFWRAAGLGSIQMLNSLYATLNYRCFLHEPSADPASPDFNSPAIFVFWHEYLPIPVYLRPHARLAMLVSQHQDAEILSQVARFAGLETVRGSTNRGGSAALKEIISGGRGTSLAITPDGPRGPRRKLAQGCIYLSSRLQIPIIALGMGYDRPWRNKKSWDQFAIPKPFSRCRAVLGPRIQVPSNLDRIQIENYRAWIEAQLNELTCKAEQWAAREISVPNSRTLTRLPPQCRDFGPATTEAIQALEENDSPIENNDERELRIAS
ncbi:MAG: lysophospholipid acyltransferase family protein [Planctomycetota bacterium]